MERVGVDQSFPLANSPLAWGIDGTTGITGRERLRRVLGGPAERLAPFLRSFS